VSQANIELVQTAMAAYFAGDETKLRSMLTADVRVTTRLDQPDTSDLRGYEGFLHSTREWQEAWRDYSYEVQSVSAIDDVVLVDALQTGEGALSGVPIEAGVTFVFTVEHEKIARLQMFGSVDEARRVLGLERGQPADAA
jgi:ketosteroid isomerase-like protein